MDGPAFEIQSRIRQWMAALTPEERVAIGEMNPESSLRILVDSVSLRRKATLEASEARPPRADL